MSRWSESGPPTARYLLRIDDLCPTVDRERWQRCRGLVEEFQLRPILAVVPDNQDVDLQVSPADPEFWHSIRALELAGAAVGLHGYRHLCLTRGHSLMPLHNVSEFAGVPAETQRAWIQEGLRILREHGLEPKIWIAPRHGFDRKTMLALRGEGIQFVSDGFARRPFQRDGLTWIPQQIWAPVDKRRGLWTICMHPNTAGDAQLLELGEFLRSHRQQFTSLDHILAEFDPRPLSLVERVGAEWSLRKSHSSPIKGFSRSLWPKRNWS